MCQCNSVWLSISLYNHFNFDFINISSGSVITSRLNLRDDFTAAIALIFTFTLQLPLYATGCRSTGLSEAVVAVALLSIRTRGTADDSTSLLSSSGVGDG